MPKITKRDQDIARRILRWIRGFKISGDGVHFQNTEDGAIAEISWPEIQQKKQNKETVSCVIIGTETGGGKYKGSVLQGQSTGNTSNNFQIQTSTWQTATDGPTPISDIHGAWLNNALIINMREQYVPNSHILYKGSFAFPVYVQGRIMGTTSETTPRTIVYIDEGPCTPVIATITNQNPGTQPGVYYGYVWQGTFGNTTNGYNFKLPTFDPGAPATSTCWIRNNWEQANVASAIAQLPVGTPIFGILTGYPWGIGGNPFNNQPQYMVDCWLPIQAANVSPLALSGPSGNETLIQAQFNALLLALQAAGLMKP